MRVGNGGLGPRALSPQRETHLFTQRIKHTQEIEFIVEEALALHSERIYGGFVFMAGGSLAFTGCFFWDFEVITPLDRIYLGGDVLVRALAEDGNG